jgi:NADPH:quinone reductase-like Zn-dependent oxidoreductase
VVVGLLSGSQAEIDLGLVLSRRLTMVGTILRGRPLEEKIAAVRLFERQVVPWFERGVVRPVVDSTFAIDDARDAYARVESNEGFGKVILRL